MSTVPCDVFSCDRMLTFVPSTGGWVHAPVAGKSMPLHLPVPPMILPAVCAIDGCEFRIARDINRWAHVDTHGIDPGHEAVSFEDLPKILEGCTDHPGRESHCDTRRCGFCWLCKEAAARAAVRTKSGDVPLEEYGGFVAAFPGVGIVPLEDVEPRAARPTWDEWALGIAAAVAVRADCTRRQVGAVILDSDHRIVATGYNGYPSGMPGCASAGACPRGRKTYAEIPKDSAYVGTAAPCDALHAEENAVLHAHRSLKGCWIYVTHKPCPNCERLLRGTGILGARWPDGYILF